MYASKGMPDQVPLIHTSTESAVDEGDPISCYAQATLVIMAKSLGQTICVLERPGKIPATLTLGRTWKNVEIHKIEVTTIPGNSSI